MTTVAMGKFEVKVTPQASDEVANSAALGRMSLEKTFHGDLDGTSVGTMLTASGSVKGSAGYVAVERFTGALHGRSGSFALQHSGSMNRGAPSLTITVVPDTGTEALTGISGSLKILIADGNHSYEFTYELPAGA